MADALQAAAGQTVELPYADQRYTGNASAVAAQPHCSVAILTIEDGEPRAEIIALP